MSLFQVPTRPGIHARQGLGRRNHKRNNRNNPLKRLSYRGEMGVLTGEPNLERVKGIEPSLPP
jgi:hypothetical protein